MPLYEYECRSCNHRLEELQKVDDKPLKLCPECKKNTLFRVITGGLGFFMSGRTLGIVADKNSSKFSDDFKQHLKTKNRTNKQDNLSGKLPDGAEIVKTPNQGKINPLHKKLRKADEKQIKTYIETGKI